MSASDAPFGSVLIANRGEIARRVIKTCRQLGVRTVAVYSDADASALHVREADEAVALGGLTAAESYLDGSKIIRAAQTADADAIHPGYGFLSESAEFARAVCHAGHVWVGPSPEAIDQMGNKINARRTVAAAGVPVGRGSAEPVYQLDHALREASVVGYPVMVKPAGGGGGIGMAIAYDDDALGKTFAIARRRGQAAFGRADLLIERYVPRARHIEVQVLGLSDGRILTLGERDCSVQRRHQKVSEETPSPGLDEGLRQRMLDAAVRAAQAVSYVGAGTVEFLFDLEDRSFLFLEMNTRLQVEHTVTELVTGTDLVEQQLRVAGGQGPTFTPGPASGHAIEFRVYAEDPARFLPSPGTIERWQEPTGKGVRVDSGYGAGDVVTPYYDPLLAKLCVWGSDRSEALERARGAVDEFTVEGIKTTLPFHRALLTNPAFISGDYDTNIVSHVSLAPSPVAGTRTG